MKSCLQTILDFFANIFNLFAQWFARIFNTKQSESMKLQLYKNIDVVQINIKEGVSEYFIPSNVAWADQVVDKILVYGSNPESGELSPIDGINPVFDREEAADLYFDLFTADDVQIANALNGQSILSTNNHPLEIGQKLSLQLSRMYFTRPPEYDACVLLYVFWGTVTKEVQDIPNKSVTSTFKLYPGKEVYLSEMIDTYIHSQPNRLKGIYVWGGYGMLPGTFITLRDYNYRTIVNLLPVGLCRPPMGVDYVFEGISSPEQAQSVQVSSMYFDDADVDFENSTLFYSFDSFIKPIELTITFLY